MIESSSRHLDEAGETYTQHLGVALGISIKLAKASAACAVHAVIPALCTKTASRTIAELHAMIAKRSELARRQASDVRPASHRQSQQGGEELGIRVFR
jgi:hypothetical protein